MSDAVCLVRVFGKAKHASIIHSAALLLTALSAGAGVAGRAGPASPRSTGGRAGGRRGDRAATRRLSLSPPTTLHRTNLPTDRTGSPTRPSRSTSLAPFPYPSPPAPTDEKTTASGARRAAKRAQAPAGPRRAAAEKSSKSRLPRVTWPAPWRAANGPAAPPSMSACKSPAPSRASGSCAAASASANKCR